MPRLLFSTLMLPLAALTGAAPLAGCSNEDESRPTAIRERRPLSAWDEVSPLLGFSIADIRELLGLWRNRARPSAAVKKIAGKHAGELRRRIGEMQSMVDTIEHLAKHCHGDHRPECPILEDLSKAR